MHVAPSTYPADRFLSLQQPRSAAPPDDTVPPSQTDDAPVKATEDTQNESKQEKMRGRGVVRLLEAGHFKGVADVRLRMNFREELAARAEQRAEAQVAPATDSLAQAAGEATDAFVEAAELDEEAAVKVGSLADEFEASLRDSIDAAADDEGLDVEKLAEAGESAFAGFVDSLRNLLSTEPVEPIEEPTEPTETSEQPLEFNLTESRAVAETPAPAIAGEAPVVEGPTLVPTATNEPLSPIEDALAVLTSAFADAMSEFISAIDGAMQLPEPTPGPGKGAAFDKFLAIYHQLGSSETTNTTDITA